MLEGAACVSCGVASDGYSNANPVDGMAGCGPASTTGTAQINQMETRIKSDNYRREEMRGSSRTRQERRTHRARLATTGKFMAAGTDTESRRRAGEIDPRQGDHTVPHPPRIGGFMSWRC